MEINFSGYEQSLRWLLKNKKQLMQECGKEKWIAVETGRVLGKGKDPQDVLEKALEKAEDRDSVVLDFLTDGELLF